MHEGNFEVYGVRKVWRQLHRDDVEVGRDHVGRLMAELGLCGVTRTKKVRTTTPAPESERPGDLVHRAFTADAPDRLWVADLTYVWTPRGFCYAAFIIDAFSRRIVGWRVSSSLRTDLALDALEMAIWSRGDLDGLIHHSDRGSQYLAIRYTERLEDAGVVNSVGSKGDSYDNALAETVNGLYKADLLDAPPGTPAVDQLGLVEPIDGLRERVIVTITLRSHRADRASGLQALGVPDREVLGGFNWSSQHLMMEVVRDGYRQAPRGDPCDAGPDVVAWPAIHGAA